MFNSFQPKDNGAKQVPFFDDVTAKDGWEGHTTSKSLDRLQSEIAENLTLIDCIFTGCRAGTFGNRHGFQIHFAMKSGDRLIPSRLDIACLPINPRKRWNRTRTQKKDPRIERTQQMALFMTAKAIKGMYFLNVLSPEFIPFMSLMLEKGGQTLGSMWMQSGAMTPLLPPPDEEFVIDAE